ncbi:MAG: hypothetical protein QCI00_07630 [Candidatus Thermoplasmatota archaeon]|nr:hypothetical protein [Candidatus Thermoplasmatota archaeon]
MVQLKEYYVERHDTNQKGNSDVISLIPEPKGFVCSGVSEIDQLLGGLSIGQVTSFFGRSRLLSTVLHRICVNTFDMFHSSTIVLDAGNQLNPYVLAHFARLQLLPYQELLHQVYLSRAFTLYQLNALVHKHMEPLIKRLRPVTVIFTGFSLLLADADISNDEASRLCTMMMEKLKKIARTYQVAMILIDKQYGDSFMINSDSFVDTTIQVKDMRHCPRITIAQQNREITVTSETFGQLCLQDFGMVI